MSRKRWIYTRGGVPLPEPIEVSEDYVPETDGRMPLFTDRYLEGTAATDGTDIGSRRKRDEYMRRNGLAHADDYRETWAKAKAEREKFWTGQQRDPERREAIARALHHTTQRKKR